MASLGLKDKIGQELFAGDRVQIVNGAKAGTVLHKIRVVGKPYTIEGDLDEKDPAKGSLEIANKKVRRMR